MKTAVITGVGGQDGAYLAEFLLRNGYRVVGTYRRTSTVNFSRLDELAVRDYDKFHLVESDITDLSATFRLIDRWKPDEVYNLAAQSFVGVSFDQPVTTSQITGIGAVNVLEAIRAINTQIRFYQASTSEMFGLVQETPQRESTPFYPRSPYGVAKLYAHWMTVNYRESYGIFASSGILFNHESPLRGREFVTRKISSGFANLALNGGTPLQLGNLDATRDWGFAGEYVRGMWAMLQIDRPETFVLATGRTVSVREFVRLAGKAAGFDIAFEGAGESEVGVDRSSGRICVTVNKAYYRPAEVDVLLGDPSKAKADLGWEATMPLEELADLMVASDLRRAGSGFDGF